MKRGIRRPLGCVVAVVAMLVACFTQPAAADDVRYVEAEAVAARGDACVPAAKCCKVCEGGKACGNSCISQSKNCHKGRGCACNAAELCP